MEKLPKQQISTTELARNLANVIDQVRVSRTSVVVTKGSQEVAQLVPVAGNGTTLADLQALVASTPLSIAEKQAFGNDIQSIREAVSLPESPWES
ncbi:MAG: type II toxin-antitoxin system prevent-host-death family antitoxin [Leucothrix sp.]